MIGKEQFFDWKHNPVTEEVFKALQLLRTEINQTLNSEDFLLGKDAHTQIPKLLGRREGIDLILEITIDDLEEEDEEDLSPS